MFDPTEEALHQIAVLEEMLIVRALDQAVALWWNNSLNAIGYLRLAQIIGNPKADLPVPAIIPVSKSTWWAGIKTGRFPQPVRTLGGRITAWRVEDIRALINSAAGIVSFDQ